LVNLTAIKRLNFLPLVVFAGGLAFLVFSLFGYQSELKDEFNPTHSSRILTLKLRLDAIEKARAEGRTSYEFDVNEAYPMYNPFEGVDPDEIRQSS